MSEVRRKPVTLRARPGFTLTEMIVSLSISALVIAVFYGTIANMQKTYRIQRDQRTAEDALRMTEQVLRLILQSAKAAPYPALSGPGNLNPDMEADGLFDSIEVTSDFNPPDGDFNDELERARILVVADTLKLRWRIADGTWEERPLAHPVRSLKFEYYDSDLTPLTTVAAVSDAASVKVTISAAESPTSTKLRRREVWIFLQNRRS